MKKKDLIIIVPDRNPHIRNLLEREFLRAGYQVRIAENADQVLQYAYAPETVDLIVIDPDLPGAEAGNLMEKLGDRVPSLFIVIHVLPGEIFPEEKQLESFSIVEKDAVSVESLKTEINTVFAGTVKGRCSG